MSMAETAKGVTEDCLVFYDFQQKVTVNVIPLDRFLFVRAKSNHARLDRDFPIFRAFPRNILGDAATPGQVGRSPGAYFQRARTAFMLRNGRW